ncbi:phosphoribosyltransferase [Endozoicomonadaceae bacterium StTr2]
MKTINWNSCEKLVSTLANQVTTSRFMPDMLIAVTRGGWVPARLLARQLKIKPMASIGLSYRDTERKQLEAYSLPSGVSGKRLLVIEDRLETGKSLIKAVELLQQQSADVCTACFYIRSDSLIKPDFYLGEDDQEIIFPWD